MKRLAIYFDGTWSLPLIRTNVYRLYQATADVDPVAPADGETRAGGPAQESAYWNGVGTRALEWLRGGALGFGTNRNLRQAYAWLAERYEDGDEIFILGFSRGAYAARSLAGMIARCGLLQPDATTTVDEIFQRYEARNEDLVADSRRIPIHFLGVWDTVGALGVPWGAVPEISRSTTLFHNTNPHPLYRNMFQALAIDEHRAVFAPTLWTGDDGFTLGPTQRLEQRWFAGAHGDVGGGGLEGGLSRITLRWMAEQARECGLVLTRSFEERTDDYRGRMLDSFTIFLAGAYRLAQLNRRFYRPIGAETTPTPAGPERPLNETIDVSVVRRWQRDASYRRAAKNLATWADTRGLDLAEVEVDDSLSAGVTVS